MKVTTEFKYRLRLHNDLTPRQLMMDFIHGK